MMLPGGRLPSQLQLEAWELGVQSILHCLPFWHLLMEPPHSHCSCSPVAHLMSTQNEMLLYWPGKRGQLQKWSHQNLHHPKPSLGSTKGRITEGLHLEELEEKIDDTKIQKEVCFKKPTLTCQDHVYHTVLASSTVEEMA